MRWFSIEDPMFEPFPPWMKAFGVAKQDGVIYLPAAIGGPEELVLRKASDSGVPSATRHEHGYVPAEWLAEEFSHAKDVCSKLLIMAEQVRPTDLQCVVRYLELAAALGELDDVAISRALDGENYARGQITDATWFIPIALGRRVLAKKGVAFSPTYDVFSPDGHSIRQGVFAESGIYNAAHEMQSDALPETVVKKLALRSPEVHGYQEAMAQGARPQDLRTPPVIFFTGRPTEAGLLRAQEYAQKLVRGVAT